MKVVVADPLGVHRPIHWRVSPIWGSSISPPLYVVLFKDVELRYLRSHLTPAMQLRQLLAFQPDLIAFSFVSRDAEATYATINSIQEHLPQVTIVCGGPHPTIAPEEVLTRSKAALCFLGEGEATMVEIVRCAREREPWSAIRASPIVSIGACYAHTLAPTDPPSGRHTLPGLGFGGLERNRPATAVIVGYPPVSILLSRGCKGDCPAAPINPWHLYAPMVRKRSPTTSPKKSTSYTNKASVNSVC
jgi:hypothetical protein